MIKWLLFPISLVFLFSANILNAETIQINKVIGDKEELSYEILKLALSKSDPNIKIQQHSEFFNEARLINEVEDNNIDVVWAGTSPEWESRLHTVRIPMFKGLLGHRLFIIRSEDQPKFSQITSLTALKQFEAGQGRFWGDTKVLMDANIPTVTTIKYDNLFPMLEGGRFDYFPRAVHEPWVEVQNHADLNLVVEKDVMLVYPYAMYFFVNKSNRDLHSKISQGFELAIQDGSFDDLFFNHPMIKDVLEQANLQDRTVLRIDNPHMHEDTPFERSEFWLDINNL